VKINEQTKKQLVKYRIAYIILNDRIGEKKTPADEVAQEIIEVCEGEFGYRMTVED